MGLRLARARQQKAFHTGPSYGAVSRKISCLVWIIIGRQTARAVCVQGACRVRAGCVLCGQGGHRQKPGDGCAMSHQEISIVRQKWIPQPARPWAGCGRGCGRGRGGGAVLCGAVRPLSRQGISTACPLGTDLGMKVDLPRPPRGAGQVGVVQGGSAGRGRLFRDARRCRLRLCTRGTTPCRCRALTCSGRGWVDTRA